MDWRVVEESPEVLADYARLPIAFRVERRFEVVPVDAGLGGIVFREEGVERPYVKDYDAQEGQGLVGWDLTNWRVLSIYEGKGRVGGAVLAFDTAGVDVLEGRTDLTVLWDIRVTPAYRRRGLGAVLFRAAEAWARARGCRQLKVETQNVNVPACRFYVKQGCVLGAINRFAYPDFPGEVQLFWYKDLTPDA